MFKPTSGTCVRCEKEDQLIVVKKGYCQKCNWEIKQEKKKAEGKKTGRYVYKKEPTGEKDTFHAVLDNLDDKETKCFVCGIPIAVVTHNNFAHVLNKKKFPMFRNNPENIKILCHRIIAGTNEKTGKPTNGCHSDFDTKPRSELTHEMWNKLFELEEKLKKEYKEMYGN